MNKGLRAQLKKHKFRNRLKRFGFIMKTDRDYKCYRTTSTPCSCALCSPGKEIQTGLKKKAFKELQFQLNN